MADKELNELNLELEDLKDLDLADASEISVVEELEREIVDEDLSSDNGEDRKLINDGVYLYLKEIGKIPALAPGEELTLASLIEQGGAVGEKAKRKLVQANLRLVISVAKRYAKDAWTLLDLIQEGNLGLMRAADKFDRVKGYKFSTCAIWWIRQAISRSFADKSRSIRIPAHMIEQASKLRKAKLELTQVLGRIPTEFELAAVLEINIEKLREVDNLQMQTISMSTPIGKEQEADLSEFIESDSAFASPDAALISKMLKAQIKKSIEFLSEEEQNILILRYGLVEEEGERIYTLEEVSDILNIPKQSVRKIEAKALRKLKGKIVESGRLEDYL